MSSTRPVLSSGHAVDKRYIMNGNNSFFILPIVTVMLVVPILHLYLLTRTVYRKSQYLFQMNVNNSGYLVFQNVAMKAQVIKDVSKQKA